MEIRKVDDTRIVVIETQVNERLISKATIEAQKAGLLAQIAQLDEMLNNFG